MAACLTRSQNVRLSVTNQHLNRGQHTGMHGAKRVNMIKFYPTEFAGSHEIIIAYFNERRILTSANKFRNKSSYIVELYSILCWILCKNSFNKKRGSEGAQTSKMMLSTSIAFAKICHTISSPHPPTPLRPVPPFPIFLLSNTAEVWVRGCAN